MNKPKLCFSGLLTSAYIIITANYLIILFNICELKSANHLFIHAAGMEIFFFNFSEILKIRNESWL